MSPAFRHPDLYSAVFTAAEKVVSWSDAGMPAGAQAKLWQALDRLKDLGVPASDVRSAEDMSVAIHRISLASRRQGAAAEAERHRQELSRLSQQWLTALPMSLSR